MAPSGRYLSLLAAGIATTPGLPDDIWCEIDAWAAEENARLSAKQWRGWRMDCFPLS